MNFINCRAGLFVTSLKWCDVFERTFGTDARRRHVRACYLHSVLQIVRVINCTESVLVVGAQVREQYRAFNCLRPFDSAIILNPTELTPAQKGR